MYITNFPQKYENYINKGHFSGIMKFSQTELKILEQISQGNTTITGIAKAIKKSEKQIYRANQKLAKKGFLELSKGNLEPKKASHVTLLLHLLADYPNLARLLSESGIEILSTLLKPKTVGDVTDETGLKKSIVYKKLRQARAISVIKKENKQYFLNEKLWSKLRDFLGEFKRLIETTDPRIPANSVIYYKTDKEIIFANKAKQDAILTAFSIYETYGIKLFIPTNYYYLPKKSLSKKEILMHSLYITEKEKTIRHLIYVTLFYLKFKRYLSLVKHPIIEKIRMVLKGEKIPGYPGLEEITEKAGMYDIKF